MVCKLTVKMMLSSKVVSFLSKNCQQFFQKTAAKKLKLEDNTALKIHPIMFCQD